MKFKITNRQKELLQTIYNSLENDGYPPSFEEIKTKLNISSNQAIIDHLKSLEKKGFIKREEGSARAIVIRPAGYEILGKSSLVNLAGVTAAGTAISAIEQHEWIAMPSGYQKLENLFVVRVSGSSMIEAGIYDGDAVIIKEQKQYKSGDIVLARIGEEVTLKRFIHDKGRTYLKPENPACRNIPITNDTFFIGKFIGKVEGV